MSTYFKKTARLIGILTFCLAGAINSFAQEKKEDLSHWLRDVSTAKETNQEYEQRMQWFKEARFGLFIHWGAYSQLGGEWNGAISENGEWVQLMLNIPSSKYQNYVKSFNPVKYNPDEWAHLFKEAGLKYICITSKHHDGFCLWDSKVNNDWDVAVSKGKKDLLQPLAEACKKEGIKYCIYYSVLDWHHPDWPGRPGFNDIVSGTPDKQRYINNYMYPQLKELFAPNDIGMIWLDGTWDEQNWSSEDGRRLEEYIHSLQPGTIINNRSGYLPPQPKFDFISKIKHPYGFIIRGDYITPERDVPPAQLPGLVWETCQTIWHQNSWGYHRLAPFRSTKELIHLLIQIASKGGNLLLNVGPTAEGEIPVQAKELLLNMGKWLKINGEAIYGTTSSPFTELPFDGYCTRKQNKLYFHLTEWPGRQITIPLTNRVNNAYLLARPGNKLIMNETPTAVTVMLPEKQPDPYASVIVLEIEGEPQVTADAELEANYIQLKAQTALLQGLNPEIKMEEFNGVNNIGNWTKSTDWLQWNFGTDKEAMYDAYLQMACDESSVGSKLNFTIGDNKIEFKVPATSDGWTNFQVKKIGEVKLPAGKFEATIKCQEIKGEAVKIRKLIIVPRIK